MFFSSIEPKVELVSKWSYARWISYTFESSDSLGGREDTFPVKDFVGDRAFDCTSLYGLVETTFGEGTML